MKVNNIKLLMVLLLILSGCMTKSVNIKDNNYFTIETQECSLPIPKRFKKIEKYHYTYSSLQENSYISSSIGIIDSSKIDYYSYSLDTIEKHGFMELLSTYKTKHFSIIEFRLDGDKNNYRIIGKKSIIQLLSLPKLEATYMIDYCEKTKK